MEALQILFVFLRSLGYTMNDMKKFSFAILLAILFVACNQSPEKKIEALVKNEVKNTLFKPDSYDPISTKVDSAFAPYDDPALFEEMSTLIKLSSDFSELEEEVKNAKSSMAIWNGGKSAFNKNEYQEAEDKYNEASGRLEKLRAKVQKSYDTVYSILQTDKRFIGYKALHSYRADTNAGETLIIQTIYYVDKDLKDVQYALELEEYNQMQESISNFVEEYMSEEEE